MEEAERVSRELGMRRILVNSGIGVRKYYRGLGYERDGIYLARSIRF